MDYKAIIKPEVETDLDNAIQWYEKQREGLGIDFLLHFEEALNFVRDNPFVYEKTILHFRRALMGKFPYAIYYAVNEDAKNIDVYAVLHQSRNPTVHKKRLKLD